MAVTDEYLKLKTKDMDRTFSEIISLKEQRGILDKQIKELELIYKPQLVGTYKDRFYELDNGVKISLKHSVRQGSVNTKSMVADGIDVEHYRGESSEVWTLRTDK